MDWMGWNYERREYPEAALVEHREPDWSDPNGLLAVYRLPGGYRIKFLEQVAFDCSFERRSIVERQLETPVARESIDHFLNDLVYPRLLAWEGAYILHGSAVRIGDTAAIFIGPSGRGKSTLCASFDLAGYDLLGDDALLLSGLGPSATVEALSPSLRLLPDSISALFARRPSTRRLGDYTSKHRVDYGPDEGRGREVLPVAAIFMLGEPTSKGAITIERASAAEACVGLITNSFDLDPSDRDHTLKKFARSSRLAKAMPVFRLSYPRDYARLAEVRSQIIDRIERLSGLRRSITGEPGKGPANDA